MRAQIYSSSPYGTCDSAVTEDSHLAVSCVFVPFFLPAHVQLVDFYLGPEWHGLICAGQFNNWTAFGIQLESKDRLVRCSAQPNKPHFTLPKVHQWLLTLGSALSAFWRIFDVFHSACWRQDLGDFLPGKSVAIQLYDFLDRSGIWSVGEY